VKIVKSDDSQGKRKGRERTDCTESYFGELTRFSSSKAKSLIKSSRSPSKSEIGDLDLTDCKAHSKGTKDSLLALHSAICCRKIA